MEVYKRIAHAENPLRRISIQSAFSEILSRTRGKINGRKAKDSLVLTGILSASSRPQDVGVIFMVPHSNGTASKSFG
jgi:hypothetical protein